MALPFVRDLFADMESLPAFSRVASHLKEGTGRICVSGLAPTAKALLLVLLQKAAGRPVIVVVPDNRAAEDTCAGCDGELERKFTRDAIGRGGAQHRRPECR